MLGPVRRYPRDMSSARWFTNRTVIHCHVSPYTSTARRGGAIAGTACFISPWPESYAMPRRVGAPRSSCGYSTLPPSTAPATDSPPASHPRQSSEPGPADYDRCARDVGLPWSARERSYPGAGDRARRGLAWGVACAASSCPSPERRCRRPRSARRHCSACRVVRSWLSVAGSCWLLTFGEWGLVAYFQPLDID